MGRPEGSRNAGYDDERERLSRLLLERLSHHDGPQTSFRQLAVACGVSPPTLRHYFSDRHGALIAAMRVARQDGASYLEIIAHDELGDLRESLTALLRNIIMGWERFQMGHIARFGLEAGLGDNTLGRASVEELWEPVLDAFTARMAMHMERGELRHCDPRLAATMLLSPIIMALLHQREMGGSETNPIDLYELLDLQLEGFLRAFSLSPDAPIPSPRRHPEARK